MNDDWLSWIEIQTTLNNNIEKKCEKTNFGTKIRPNREKMNEMGQNWSFSVFCGHKMLLNSQMWISYVINNNNIL